MSEINAIATNNYILHNIDAKKLYVQEPLFTANSGDAVYVGWRPDETVLWETPTAGTTASAFAVSEPLSSFEYLMISGRNNRDFYTMGYYVPNNGFRFGATQWTDSGDGNPLQMFGAYYTSTNGVDYSCAGGHQIYFAKTGSTIGGGGPRQIGLYKIVGVNRKENA